MARTQARIAFWLPYGLIAALFLASLRLDAHFGGLSLFEWSFVFVAVIIGIWLAILKRRGELDWPAVPEAYSPQHLLLLLWFSLQGLLVDQGLHMLFEPYLVLVIFIIPAGYVIGAMGRVWHRAVVSPVLEMATKGIAPPARPGYFAPLASYAWLWHFARGVELLSARRIRAGGAFAAVLFLGVLGFLIVRARLKRVAAI